MTELMTADWSPLGDIFYRKFELYQMHWTGLIDVSEYEIAGAAHGGPFAVMKKGAYSARSATKQLITIFSAAGHKLHEFRWQEGGELIYIAWTQTEELICVQDDGDVLMYNIFGEVQSRFDMGEEVADMKILDCRVFPSLHDSGIVVMTTSHKFYMKSDISKQSRARRLAEVPGLRYPPSSWTPIVNDNSVSVLVAKDDLLYMIDQLGQCSLQQLSGITDSSPLAYTEMAVSVNGKYIALFTASGTLWIGTSNLQRRFCEMNTKTPQRPTQMVWCGGSAVILFWNPREAILFGHNNDWIKYQFDSDIKLIQEPDGVRVVTDDLHEFIHRVPDVTDRIFRIGSVEPGAMLFEAAKEFRRHNKKVNDYIQVIGIQMDDAVKQCIQAASYEFEPAKQRELLRAATFGLSFVKSSTPDAYHNMCQMIRILNSLRGHHIGIPLTYKQLELLTLPTLIDRIVYRRQYLLARKICQYLKMKEEENKILSHWACYKVEHSRELPDRIAADIKSKLGESSTVSYFDIASKAIEIGKKELAITLLENEPRASKQVPLLLKIRNYETALKKAIDSGDENLIYHVIFVLGDCLPSQGDFLLEIRKYPVALNLYLKYRLSEGEKRDRVEELYDQDDRHCEVALSKVIRSFEEFSMRDRRQRLEEAAKKFKDGQDEWSTKMTKNELLLISRQEALELENISCINTSLQRTLHILIVNGKHKLAELMKKEFAVSDRRFWWMKIHALAEANNWTELDTFSRSKKSPIGYRPFVEACVKYNNKTEAAKYLSKVVPEDKVRCLISIGELEQAAETAYQRKSEDELNMVLQHSSVNDRAVIERVNRLKAQL